MANLTASQSGDPDFDYHFKVFLLGDSGTGKTNLLLRFSDADYNPNYTSTLGVDIRFLTIVVKGKRVKFELWDTAGQEQFKSITQQHLKGSHGVAFVYDVANSKSFRSINEWMKEVDYICGTVGRVLVANKCDLPASRHTVTPELGQSSARDNGMEFIEASAKENINVEKIFVELAKSMMGVPSVAAAAAAPTANGHDPSARMVVGEEEDVQRRGPDSIQLHTGQPQRGRTVGEKLRSCCRRTG